MAKISHVVFDLDGLLLDTEKIYTLVTQSILDRYGKKFEWSVKSKLMGLPPIESTKVLIDSLDLPMTPEEYLAEAKSKLEENFVDADLMPGATELIQHLHKVGIPMAVATSSQRREYDLKVTKHQELFKLMSHVVCSDDPLVKNGKPAPDIYLAAAQRFTNPPKSPSNVLVLEDAASGVQAAKTAGMLCVMVPDERLDPAKTKLADKVIKSLNELDLNEFGISSVTS
ncbi:uncharacterized protein [Dysidea avara]|uniref:uncharacterized protein isoform X1 n=2 Tax=Dysidea avara TaxID=196820 RepID=UPI00333257C0